MATHTPLRYPGGKGKLTPFVVEIARLNSLSGTYVEPYTGGGGVAVELLIRGQFSRIHLNDANYPLYCFWNSVKFRSGELCQLIGSAPLTIQEWERQREIYLDEREQSELAKGFSMFYLNRTNRSGIASAGPIGGLKQEGEWRIDARFNRSELIRRVRLLGSLRDSIEVTNLDAEALIEQNQYRWDANTLVYLDPPYFYKADKLYDNYYQPHDHALIAATIQQKLHVPWIVSYDKAPEIEVLYGNFRGISYSLNYSAGKHCKGRESMFFSDELVLPDNSCLPNLDLALKALTSQSELNRNFSPTLWVGCGSHEHSAGRWKSANH